MKIILFRNIKRSLIIFSLIAFLFLGLLFLSFTLEKNNFVEKMSLSLTGDISSYRETFTDEITGIASDINVMKQLISFHEVLTLDHTHTVFVSEESKTIVENSFLVMAQSLNYFDQIRIIDTTGMEISRINFNNGHPFIVASSNLQDKSDRPYFNQAITLPNQAIHISQLDLNVENGEIELVDDMYKPILRFSTPLYDSSDELLGILVVNYLVNDIFKDLHLLKQTKESEIAIINEDGYYLYSEIPSRSFGFMFTDMLDETVNKYHDFNIIASSDTSIQQYIINHDIYTTLAIDEQLLSSEVSTFIGDNVSFYTNSGPFIIYNQLTYTSLSEYANIVNLYIILAVISILIAFIMTRLFDEISQTKQDKLETLKYLANHDFLTGLPNRASIMHAIDQYVSNQQPFSLMFIDIDGFKHVNDAFGHHVGDDALIESSKRIVSNVRNIDIVARVGGDEFIVLFDQLTDKTQLTQIAKRILQAFQIELAIGSIKTSIGASIGIATYKEGLTTDDLINAADDAMYKVKQKQKNDFNFHQS